MKAATEQQKVAAAERRARFRELARKVAAMGEDQRAQLAARLPLVTVEGRALSIHNACLVAMQNPAATIVGGFRQWIKAGRAVRKGEHGLAIWVPLRKGDSDGDTTPETDGDAKRFGFIMGTVFDVTQTDEIERGQ